MLNCTHPLAFLDFCPKSRNQLIFWFLFWTAPRGKASPMQVWLGRCSWKGNTRRLYWCSNRAIWFHYSRFSQRKESCRSFLSPVGPSGLHDQAVKHRWQSALSCWTERQRVYCETNWRADFSCPRSSTGNLGFRARFFPNSQFTRRHLSPYKEWTENLIANFLGFFCFFFSAHPRSSAIVPYKSYNFNNKGVRACSRMWIVDCDRFYSTPIDL